MLTNGNRKNVYSKKKEKPFNKTVSLKTLRKVKTHGIMFAHIKSATRVQRHAAYLVPKILSPASPSPGKI